MRSNNNSTCSVNWPHMLNTLGWPHMLIDVYGNWLTYDVVLKIHLVILWGPIAKNCTFGQINGLQSTLVAIILPFNHGLCGIWTMPMGEGVNYKGHMWPFLLDDLCWCLLSLFVSYIYIYIVSLHVWTLSCWLMTLVNKIHKLVLYSASVPRTHSSWWWTPHSSSLPLPASLAQLWLSFQPFNFKHIFPFALLSLFQGGTPSSTGCSF